MAKPAEKPKAVVTSLRAPKTPSILMPKETTLLKEGQRIKIPGGEMEVTTMDPDMAQLVFDHRHPNQRVIRKGHVENLCAMILRGEWIPNLSAILMDRDLRLIDGQHRLLAIAKSGKAVKVMIMIVDDPKAFYAIDQGMVRSINDIRSTLGKKSINGTVRGAITMEAHDFIRPRATVPKSQLDKMLDDFPLMDEVNELYNTGNRAKTHIIGVGVLGAAIRCMKSARQDAFEFFTSVFECRSTVAGEEVHQAHALYRWLLSVREEAGRSTGEHFVREAAYKSVRAWNAWRDGESLMKLQYSPGSKIPKAKR